MKAEVREMTREELEQFEKYAVQEEETISIPIKQYTEAIMALQKLNDIKGIAHMDWSDEEECVTIIGAIRTITG